MRIFKLFTATVAIANFVLFMLPGHLTYYQTTSGMLGKMYSTTMMVVLNSRIVFKTQDDPGISNEHISSSVSNPRIGRRPTFGGGISVTREHWTAPLDVFKLHAHVSIDYELSFSPLIGIDILNLNLRVRRS